MFAYRSFLGIGGAIVDMQPFAEAHVENENLSDFSSNVMSIIRFYG
jgi:hypothetical protein